MADTQATRLRGGAGCWAGPASSLPLLDFSSLKGLFSGKIFLRKNIFFPEKKFRKNDHFSLLLSSELYCNSGHLHYETREYDSDGISQNK